MLFRSGLVSCLSPCVLPILPVFLAHVGGGGASVAIGGSGTTVVRTGRWRGAGFLLGFAGVFVALWVSLGVVGFAFLAAAPALRPLAGLAIVALGVATILGWRPRLPGARFGGSASFGGSFLLGAGVAVGWTPCIGPTLGAILTMAAASQSLVAGALLLVAYALGMVVPFVAVGVGLSRMTRVMKLVGRHHLAIRGASGLLIVGVGVLVATNAFSRLAGLIPWIY